MKINEIMRSLETLAPLSFQESYDNAGLITGNAAWECSGVMITLDATEAVINEAISKKCNLVIAHHPIVFKGMKKITGKNYVERTIITAIKNDVAIYAIHTNLDNVLQGVNKMIADKIGLKNTAVLQPKEAMLKKLITFVPLDQAAKVRDALFAAGAGNIGKYSECSYNTEGVGTFKPGELAKPFLGEIGKRQEEKELKIELIFPAYLEEKLIRAMNESHPYEEVAYDILPLGNYLSEVGSGLIGILENEMDELAVMHLLKDKFGLKMIRHTLFTGKKVKKIALCGGSGIFLLHAAKAAGADVYITADVKYHEFFDAEGNILLADIGHYESEQYTTDLLFDYLTQNYPNFAVLKTALNTNPVQYFL